MNLNIFEEEFSLLAFGVRVFRVEGNVEIPNKGDLISIFEVDDDENKTGRSMTAEIVHVTDQKDFQIYHIKLKVTMENANEKSI